MATLLKEDRVVQEVKYRNSKTRTQGPTWSSTSSVELSWLRLDREGPSLMLEPKDQ